MYRITTDEDVAAQVRALPDRLVPAFFDVLDVLSLVPWNGEPYNDARPDASMRRLVFGPNRESEVVYLVLEAQSRVDLLRVHWFD